MLTLLVPLGLAAAPGVGPSVAQEPTHIGAPAGTLGGQARPTDLAFRADGTLVVLEGATHRAREHRREGAPAHAEPGTGDAGRGADGELPPHGALLAATSAAVVPLPGGPAPGARPAGLAPLPGGGLAWCDAERHVVVVAASGSAPPRVLATRGTGADAVFAPEGLAVDAAGGRLAVADTGNRRVLVLHLEGGAPSVVVDPRLVRPIDVAFLPPGAALPDGGLAVLDADTSRVELFDLAGTWRGGFGDWGYFPGLFAAPQGLTTFGEEIFVADTDNHRVQVFAPKAGAQLEYELRYAFGAHAIRPGDGDGMLHYPTDVAVAPDGSFAAVCEPLDGRVQLFRRAPGKEPPEDPLRVGIGQASAHYGRVADVDGQFMVLAEPESRRVKLYDLRLDEPAEIGITGGHGERLGMLMRPSGLALDSETRELLVADAALRRLARVRLDIDPAESLRYDYARETWVEALELGMLGAGVLAADARPIEPWELDRTRDGGAVLVDGANGRVLALGPDLLPRRELLTARDGAVAPVDVVVTPDGAHAWVADAGGGAVFRVALGSRGDGSASEPPLRIALGATARGPGDARPVARPMNLTVAPDGRVFVADVLCHSLRVIAVDGETPREVETLGAGGRAVFTGSADEAWLPRRGLQPLWFSEPADLGFDGRGRLLVIDHGNHRGVILGADGEVALGFGSRLYIEALAQRRRR